MINLEVLQAINLATRIYDGIKREGSDLPYITHSFSVFLIVKDHSDDVSTQVAALFHDFFKKEIPKPDAKDPGQIYDYTDLVLMIGISAARLVDEISHYRDSQNGALLDWRSSKYEALGDFHRLSPPAKIIFAANQVHNLFSLVEDYKHKKMRIWEIFGVSEELMATYYRDIMQTLVTHFHHPLIQRYYDIFREACQLFAWEEIYKQGTAELVWAESLRTEP
ncbi:MAG: HD domain-containing protein [Patescibacteria group bacterium]